MRNYTEDELLKERDEIKNTSLPGTVIGMPSTIESLIPTLSLFLR